MKLVVYDLSVWKLPRLELVQLASYHHASLGYCHALGSSESLNVSHQMPATIDRSSLGAYHSYLKHADNEPE